MAMVTKLKQVGGSTVNLFYMQRAPSLEKTGEGGGGS
jgi:hypothetical protein